jgi:hypothetical protein
MNISSRCGMESIDALPPEKIAFIAYNIVYESVQKFGRLITSGKITNGTDVSRVAELLSESLAFYDAEMISELMNTMLQHTNNNAINRVTAGGVRNIMDQLKVVEGSIP